MVVGVEVSFEAAIPVAQRHPGSRRRIFSTMTFVGPAPLRLVVAGLLVVAGCSDESMVTSEGDGPKKAVADVRSLETEPGTWLAATPSPLSARWNPTTLWTGDAVVVWGGTVSGYEVLLDGAIFEPDTGSWTLIPPAPLPERKTSAFWVDDQLVAWVDAFHPTLSRGATYSRSAGVWRPIASQPAELGMGGIGVAADDAVFVASVGEPDAAPSMASYDPASDTWQMLAPPPPSDASVSVLHHDGEIVLLGCDGTYGAAYDSAARSWREHEPPPAAAANCYSSPPTFPSMIELGDSVATWPSRDAPRFRRDGDDEVPRPGARFDRATASWHPIAAAPNELPARAVTAGDRVIVWGGGEFSDPACDDIEPLETTDFGGTYSPEDDVWRRIDSGPLSPRNGHAIAWTGEALFVWGGASTRSGPGCEAYADGALWTPAASYFVLKK